MRSPTEVEMTHLQWMAQFTLPLGVQLPATIAKRMHSEGWITWAAPGYPLPGGTPYYTARITSSGRAVLARDDRGNIIPYPHGSEWPWTLPEYRAEFLDEIAYTENALRRRA